MNLTTAQNKGEASQTVDRLMTILSCTSGTILLFLTMSGYESIYSITLNSYLLFLIAMMTVISALAHGYFMHFQRSLNPKVHEMDLNDVHHTVNELSKNDEVRGGKVLLQAAKVRWACDSAIRSPNNRDVIPEMDNLQRHIDRCASIYNISGARLLIAAVLQRIENRYASLILSFSSRIIHWGGVRLTFLEDQETPRSYYHDMWSEDIEYMPTVRLRTRFALARIPDALGIVIDFGLIRRLHKIYQTRN